MIGDLKCTCRNELPLNGITEEEDHHAGIDLVVDEPCPPGGSFLPKPLPHKKKDGGQRKMMRDQSMVEGMQLHKLGHDKENGKYKKENKDEEWFYDKHERSRGRTRECTEKMRKYEGRDSLKSTISHPATFPTSNSNTSRPSHPLSLPHISLTCERFSSSVLQQHPIRQANIPR
ncbi:hypothetical protein E2C01_000040 [Portunus trituberculatus]|uniref:Uncharacterized protein n=1 Tax=Portunus trituberculatus TaxID=210409 RepID=A0A5B7CE14_PORTR|nr:hypothetical protein [Portunus trituberculatus]